MLDLVFKGQAFFGGMARGFPMVRASCVSNIPLWERILVDLPESYYGHLVGDEGWQEVSYVIEIRLNSGIGFRGKFLIEL